MGNLIFIRFVLTALLLHTAQTEEPIVVPKGGDIYLLIGNLTEGYSIRVTRTDMNETYYVYFERDGQSDEVCQHSAYQGRTSRENEYIIIRNAATTDNGTYAIALIPDEESERNRLQTPPTRTYTVLIIENLWLMVGLSLGGFIVVLAAVALGFFFYKPLKELCHVYFCQCFSKKESNHGESNIPM